MSRFTTLLWDVDNTLLDFDYSQRYALTKCFRSIGREITEEQIVRYAQINDDFWRRLELGKVTKAQLLPGRFAALFQEFGIEDVDVEAFRQEYQTALGSVFSFRDDSLAICKSLRGSMKQYVITNGVSSTQRNKLELSGLAAVMDGIFISEEVGMPKPDIRFFEYCMDHIEEKDKSRILVVGDSLTSDIKGGLQAGLPTCWYHVQGGCAHRGGASDAAKASGCVKEYDTADAGGCYKPDYEISDLHMIYRILED